MAIALPSAYPNKGMLVNARDKARAKAEKELALRHKRVNRALKALYDARKKGVTKAAPFVVADAVGVSVTRAGQLLSDLRTLGVYEGSPGGGHPYTLKYVTHREITMKQMLRAFRPQL